MTLPDFLRYFLRDFIEGALVILLALTFSGDLQAFGHTVVISTGVAAVAAARRNFPRFIAWLNETLKTTPS